MPLFSIFAVGMLITLLVILLVAAILSEVVLYPPIARRLSCYGRKVYYALSAAALLLYFVMFFFGRLTDYSSSSLAVVGSVAVMIFLLNAVAKITFAAALLLTRATHRKGWLKGATAVTAAIVLLVGYGVFERSRLTTEELELSFEKLPASADGMRIVHVGDIHIGLNPSRRPMLRKLVERINSLNADMVLFCGDLINAKHTELDDEAMAVLSQIHAPKGIYSVIGNHDNGMYINDTVKLPRAENLQLLLDKERSMGWTVLVDSTVYVRFDNDSIAVTGLDYPAELKRGSHGRQLRETDYVRIYDALPCGTFDITIAHYPNVWDNVLLCDKADLTLAGHVHSMQLKIPIGPRGWSPAALVYDYWSGLYDRGGRYLNVTDGTGSSVPVRIGVPPVISLITLRRK